MKREKYEFPVFSGRTIRKVKGYAMLVAAGSLFLGCLFWDVTGIMPRIWYICVPAFILGLVLSRQEKHIMKRCVWRLDEEGIRRSFFGMKEYVSYGEIREALQSKKVKITAAAFKIPKKRGYITFHYEVGNDTVQKTIIESYKFLMKEINVEIPYLSLKVIRQMDRSFYYKNDRRNCVIFMLIAAVPMLFAGKENPFAGILAVALGLYVQYTMLSNLFKGIYFGKKVEERISGMFAPYENAELRRVKVSYARMAAAVLSAILANLCFLYVGWRWN